MGVGTLLTVASMYMPKWSVAETPMTTTRGGLYSGCAEMTGFASTTHHPTPGTACFTFENSSSAMGLHFSDKSFGLLRATRAMCTLQAVLGAFSIACTLIFATTSASYRKAWNVVPLVAACLSLVIGVLALSFYGGVHAMTYAHAAPGHASLGPAWVMELIATIVQFATLAPLITVRAEWGSAWQGSGEQTNKCAGAGERGDEARPLSWENVSQQVVNRAALSLVVNYATMPYPRTT